MSILPMEQEISPDEARLADAGSLKLFRKPLYDLIDDFERVGKGFPVDLFELLLEVGRRALSDAPAGAAITQPVKQTGRTRSLMRPPQAIWRVWWRDILGPGPSPFGPGKSTAQKVAITAVAAIMLLALAYQSLLGWGVLPNPIPDCDPAGAAALRGPVTSRVIAFRVDRPVFSNPWVAVIRNIVIPSERGRWTACREWFEK